VDNLAFYLKLISI